MRLFIAIPLAKDIAKIVWNVQEDLRGAGASGDFVPRGNHHITLRFLGDSDDLVDIAAAMRSAVRDAKPFTLRVGEVSGFARGSTETTYLSVTDKSDELRRLHDTLETALREAGFARGGRFAPHITLGRRVLRGEAAMPEIAPTAFRVNSIVLFESRRVGDRMTYTAVHTEGF